MNRKLILALAGLGGIWTIAVPTSYAGSAQIIGLYENCRFTNVAVFTSNSSLPENVGVEAEIAAAKAGSFDQATRAAKEVLHSYGLDQVQVERRGYAGCAPAASGKFVEALGHYCEGKLIKAEILVDGKLFASMTENTRSFEEFVASQKQRLKKQGIPDEPKITVQNDQSCVQPQTS